MLAQIRRANLAALIDERFEGNRAAFCRATGKNPNLINLILSKNPDLQRSIGEKLSRDIEGLLDLPSGWLDKKSPNNTERSSSIPVVSSVDARPGEEWLVLLPETLRAIAPNVPTAGLAVVKAASDHMAPSINLGDLVLINKSVKVADSSGGVFAIDTGDGIVLARFRKTIQEGWSISYDNEAYPAAPISQAFLAKQKVVGRAVANLAVQRL